MDIKITLPTCILCLQRECKFIYYLIEIENDPRIRVQITQNSEIPYDHFPLNNSFVVQYCCIELTNHQECLLKSKPVDKLDVYPGEI